jgi:hypothetical protein
MPEALGSIPSTKQGKKRKLTETFKVNYCDFVLRQQSGKKIAIFHKEQTGAGVAA